jgi:hypothetical protein
MNMDGADKNFKTAIQTDIILPGTILYVLTLSAATYYLSYKIIIVYEVHLTGTSALRLAMEVQPVNALKT